LWYLSLGVVSKEECRRLVAVFERRSTRRTNRFSRWLGRTREKWLAFSFLLIDWIE
jgi:hypothetical protein